MEIEECGVRSKGWNWDGEGWEWEVRGRCRSEEWV